MRSPDGVGRAMGKRLARNASWLLGARSLLVPLALVQSVLTARLLGVEGLGLLGIVLSINAVVRQLSSFRVQEVVVKYVAEALESKSRSDAASLLKLGGAAEALTASLAWGIVWSSAPWAAQWFAGDPTLADTVRLYSTVLLLDGLLETCQSGLQVFDRFSRLAGFRVGRKLVLLTGILVVWSIGGGLREVVTAHLVAHGIASLALLVYTVSAANQILGSDWWKSPISLLRGRLRPIARFAGATHVGSTVSLATRDADPLWIAVFRPADEVGLYRLALDLLKVPFLATAPLVQATYPELARAFARGKIGVARELLYRATRLASFWVVPASLAVLAFAHWAVGTFYGAAFLAAVPAIYALLLGRAVSNLLFWARPALLALDRSDVTLRLSIAIAVAKTLAMVLTVPRWGYMAAAVNLSLAYCAGILFMLLAIHREMRARESAASRLANATPSISTDDP